MHAAQSPRFTVAGMHRDATPKCAAKKFPGGCYQYPSGPKSTLTLWWCVTKTNPCDYTSNVTGWTGFVTSVKTGNVFKPIQVTWSGPFPCDAAHCNGATTGTYEQDALTNNKALKPTTGYKDEQVIHGCVSQTNCGISTAAGIQIVP